MMSVKPYLFYSSVYAQFCAEDKVGRKGRMKEKNY